MEPQIKPSISQYNTNITTNSRSFGVFNDNSHGSNSRSLSSSSSIPKNTRITICILRGFVVVLTFIASVVMGTGKDRARVSITNPVSMQTTNFVETVRAAYSSSFVYFIVVNVLMFIYSAASLAVSLTNKAKLKHIEIGFKISDLVFLVLLYSSNSAAISTNIAIHSGNRNIGMIKICNAVSNFCAHVTASIVLSMFASVSHFAVILLEVTGTYSWE